MVYSGSELVSLLSRFPLRLPSDKRPEPQYNILLKKLNFNYGIMNSALPPNNISTISQLKLIDVCRCPPFLEIILYLLQAFLAACRTHLLHHTLEHPMLERAGLLECEKDREDLRTALVAAQESAAVQILLECCLPTEEDQVRARP